VGYHGKPRFTGDIDFFLAVSEQNAEAVMGALNKFGFGEIGLSAEDFLKPDFVVQLGYPPNRIDLVTGYPGLDLRRRGRSGSMENWTACRSISSAVSI
jgi:hypothetical protein